jgi:DNA-binding response OmpR family regulator
MARVAAVLRRAGGGSVEGRIISCDGLTVDTGNRRVSRNGISIALTSNEYKILALLISRSHKIFTRDEIINNIKDDGYDGFDRAVDSHIKNLRQKIEDNTRAPRYILTVYGMGYRFGGEVSH